jgi:hypothetical protein
MAILAAFYVPALVWPPYAQADDERLETAIKAAYLTKLGDFVQWPPDAIHAGPFNICVLGAADFGDLLERAAAGRTVRTHPIALMRLSTMDGAQNCHLLFVPISSSNDAVRVLEATRGSAVLTVTDRQSDPSGRGIINFVIHDGRVRFEIDRRAAAANHLTISSKLLDLAVNVQE